VSWELISFAILGAALIGGFAWYERSRPPSQVVALVAALAALAIAGRIAFAALPNVKPTTDIVIFAGYALGPAPGFAVGALAGLVSNFWFGQGPWTPWQMAAWGLCGILGAALALGTRNAGRLTLAGVCGFAGVAYGALLNFSEMTYGGELSLQRFLFFEGRAVPFDAAHAIGNIAFALIAGPSMVRMLIRFRERFQWERGDESGRSESEPAGLSRVLGGGGTLVALLVTLTLAAALPPRAAGSDAPRAADWLESVENSDGGFSESPGERSSVAMTDWAMLGLEAAGRNPQDISRAGNTPIAFLKSAQREISSTGDLARTILALQGAGVSPRSFAARNLVAELLNRQRDNGSFEGWPTTTAFSVIALRAAGAGGGLDKSLQWLRGVQNQDGGWGDTPGSPSTADDTGAVLQAFAVASASNAAVRGLSYLRGAQRSGGGFPLGDSGPVNSQSTAWAIQGILAVGGNPGSFRHGGASAAEYLSFRQADDGHYRYSASSDQTPVWVTGEVLVGAAAKFFPLAVPPRSPAPAKSTTTSSSPSPSPSPSATAVPGLRPPGSASSKSPGAPGASLRSGRSPPGSPGSSPTPRPGAPASGLGQSKPPGAQASAGSEIATPGSAPWPPILIGLASGGLALGSTLWLARRHGW